MQYRKIEDCNQLLQGDPRIIQSQLIKYIIHLIEEGKLLGYDTNDIELKWKKIKSYIGKGKDKLNKKDRSYTCVEISNARKGGSARAYCHFADVLLRYPSRSITPPENKRSAKNRKVQSLQNNSS